MTAIEATQVFESKLVHHCAPTLAGIKPSNLFNCKIFGAGSAHDADHFSKHIIKSCQEKVAGTGVSIAVLLRRASGALVLVYRPEGICQVLSHQQSCSYLKACGYDTSSAESCINSLRTRMEELLCTRNCRGCEFPHEVGLLLGYPFEDVMGFIKNNGKQDVCCGHWKVYGNPDDAQKTFNSYNKCRAAFNKKFAEGTSIEELARIGDKRAV